MLKNIGGELTKGETQRAEDKGVSGSLLHHNIQLKLLQRNPLTRSLASSHYAFVVEAVNMSLTTGHISTGKDK